jgi:ATP/maltotriose-dependent transcriptional regulator MalT
MMIRTAPRADDRVTQAVAGARAGAEAVTALVTAFEAALAVGEIRRAAAMVEAHARDPRDATSRATLAELVGRLPANVVLASPSLRGTLLGGPLPGVVSPAHRVRRLAPDLVGADLNGGDRPLSTREREILGLLASGMSNREIASTLYLGVNTVKWYLKALYVRFGVSSRMECVHEARLLGLIT